MLLSVLLSLVASALCATPSDNPSVIPEGQYLGTSRGSSLFVEVSNDRVNILVKLPFFGPILDVKDVPFTTAEIPQSAEYDNYGHHAVSLDTETMLQGLVLTNASTPVSTVGRVEPSGIIVKFYPNGKNGDTDFAVIHVTVVCTNGRKVLNIHAEQQQEKSNA